MLRFVFDSHVLTVITVLALSYKRNQIPSMAWVLQNDTDVVSLPNPAWMRLDVEEIIDLQMKFASSSCGIFDMFMVGGQGCLTKNIIQMVQK